MILTVGKLELHSAERLLSGPRGSVQLTERNYALIERLMRRPGVLVSQSDLIATLYQDPDREPENAHKLLMQSVGALRALISHLGGSSVQIRPEIGVGYRMQMRVR